MSTFLNTTTNITAPYESCLYLGPISPPANNTLASCTIPACEDNRAAIEKCCSGGTITTFNDTRSVLQQNITINAEYLTCTFNEDISNYTDLTEYDPNATVFALPDCIVRNGGSRLVCNRPNAEYKSCAWDGLRTPEGTGTGFTTCGVNNDNENITGLLMNCCRSSNGTLRASQEGCAVSCSGDETLSSCMSDGYDSSLRPGGGVGYGCSNSSGSGAAESWGGSGSSTLASVLVAAVAALAMLQ